jgi:E3 ubiquitin-protein ligase UBR4
MESLLELTEALAPVLESTASRGSSAPLGATARIRAALAALHTAEKACEASDQLVVPTLGSQEGAFENVKMNFSGEQGQTIRQLLSAHMIRRGIMCCLSAPGGRRQHLAVSHEKGKITVSNTQLIVIGTLSLKDRKKIEAEFTMKDHALLYLDYR